MLSWNVNIQNYRFRCLNNWCSVHEVFVCRTLNSASHAVGEFKVIGPVILKKQILIMINSKTICHVIHKKRKDQFF